MKSILIIAEHIFPRQTTRAHRATELAKEFSRKGYHVVLYSVLGSYNYFNFEKENNIKVKDLGLRWQFRTNSSDLQLKRHLLDKVLSRIFGKLLEFPNIEYVVRIHKVLKKEINFDALISIANPHQIHWGCAKAKLRLGKKFPDIWIADCGDPYLNNGNSKKYKHKFKKFEILFLENANFITVPIKEAVDCYDKTFKDKFRVIPQGFKFNKLNNMNLKPENSVPTFAYCGNFFEGFRDPSNFLKFLSKINTEYRFIIYTNDVKLIKRFIPIFRGKLVIRNFIDRLELINHMKKFDFLINFENTNLPGQLPSKLIDYSIANRPILSINTQEQDFNVFIEFLNGIYKNRYIVNDLNNYKIEKVADSFISLL